MKPSVRSSALSAVFVVFAVLTTACSTNTTIGADPPEALEDRGVAVDPLPTATPPVATAATAAPTSPPAVAGSADTAEAAPTFDRNVDQDFTGDGVISGEDREVGKYALVSSYPAAERVPDIVPVDLTAEPLRQLSTFHSGSGRAPITTTTTTGDGNSIWVSIPADSGEICEQGPATRLAIESIAVPAPSNPAQPVGVLPDNIVAIHHGPNNRVLFYTSCNGEIRPAALATAAPDGNFSDVIELDPLLGATTTALAPSWQYGSQLPLTDYYAIGALIVEIPQRGLVATGQEPGTASKVYVDATTGRVLDVWASPGARQGWFSYEQLDSGGITVDFSDLNFSDQVIDVIAVRQSAGPSTFPTALLSGPRGVSILTSVNRDLTVEEPGSDPVTAAAWAPYGPWVALTGPGGTWLYAAGEFIGLSDLRGDVVYFSPDGSKLIIATTDTLEVIEFAPAQPPDDTDKVTAFSTLDSGGLGPIRVESLVSELRADLDMEFEIDSIGRIEVGYCVYVGSPQLPGVYMLAEAVSQTDAIITTVVVSDGPWTTPSGLRVGSPQPDVFAAFPNQLRNELHKYIGGNYLTFEPADPADDYSIKFETNGHQVTYMHAGRENWIGLVEGCS